MIFDGLGTIARGDISPQNPSRQMLWAFLWAINKYYDPSDTLIFIGEGNIHTEPKLMSSNSMIFLVMFAFHA